MAGSTPLGDVPQAINAAMGVGSLAGNADHARVKKAPDRSGVSPEESTGLALVVGRPLT